MIVQWLFDFFPACEEASIVAVVYGIPIQESRTR